jgi:hypothetical protein
MLRTTKNRNGGSVIFCFEIPIISLAFPRNQLCEQQYESIQKELATGWNTFNTLSVISHVKLPEGLAINLWFKNNVISGNRFLHESYFSEKELRPEHVVPGYHAWDGSYTELTIEWEGANTKWKQLQMVLISWRLLHRCNYLLTSITY